MPRLSQLILALALGIAGFCSAQIGPLSLTQYTQMAGLICYYDTRQHYYLRVTHDEKLGKVLGVVLTDDGVYDELAGSQTAINDWRQVFLRAAVDGAQLQFSASPDGRTWRELGAALDFSKLSDDYGGALHFTMMGLCAQDLGGTHAVADFDYFIYQSAHQRSAEHRLGSESPTSTTSATNPSDQSLGS